MFIISIYIRVAPDIRPAGYWAFFGIRYPAGYPASLAGYPAGWIPDIRPAGYRISGYIGYIESRNEMMSNEHCYWEQSRTHISKNKYFIYFETEEN